MILALDAQYHSDFYFQPIHLADGEVPGFELIVNFVGVDAPVRIPTELVSAVIKSEQQLILFNEQIDLLENYQAFFKTQNKVVWVNISAAIVDAILASPELHARLARLSFIEFAVNENFPELNLGNQNTRLMALGKNYPLVLGNFGAGMATTKPIFDGLFKRVFLDKSFIHKQMKQRSFEPFLLALRAQLSPFCQTLVVTGIDNDVSRRQIEALTGYAMQGNLWPGVSAQTLKDGFSSEDSSLN